MKTHYRKVFDSPYLSAADIVEPTVLNISHVKQEKDKTKKTKDVFNTAYFVEAELRDGEKLKPLILNAVNSKMLKTLTGSPYVEDWAQTAITVYVDNNVRFGRDIVDGLRIRKAVVKETINNKHQRFEQAVKYYKDNGNVNGILKSFHLSNETIDEIKALCNAA